MYKKERRKQFLSILQKNQSILAYICMKLGKKIGKAIMLWLLIHLGLSLLVLTFYQKDVNYIKSIDNLYMYNVKGNNTILYGKDCEIWDDNDGQIKTCINDKNTKLVVKDYRKASKSDKEQYIMNTQKKYLNSLFGMFALIDTLCMLHIAIVIFETARRD